MKRCIPLFQLTISFHVYVNHVTDTSVDINKIQISSVKFFILYRKVTIFRIQLKTSKSFTVIWPWKSNNIVSESTSWKKISPTNTMSFFSCVALNLALTYKKVNTAVGFVWVSEIFHIMYNKNIFRYTSRERKYWYVFLTFRIE